MFYKTIHIPFKTKMHGKFGSLIILMLVHQVSVGSFLSTDSKHSNANLFEAFNNNPPTAIDRDGMQPLMFNLARVDDFAEEDVINFTYLDVDIYHKYHPKGKFIQADMSKKFKGKEFDGRVFINSHGPLKFDMPGVIDERQFFNVGDFIHEVEEFSGVKVRSLHLIGCNSGKYVHEELNNFIPGLVGKSSNVRKTLAVPDEIPIYGAKSFSYSSLPFGNKYSKFLQRRMLSSPSNYYFETENHDIRVSMDALLDERFEQTDAHRRIFDKFVNRQYFPAKTSPANVNLTREWTFPFRKVEAITQRDLEHLSRRLPS